MNTDAVIVIFALVAAFGLLGVIAVDYFTLQKADARGCTANGIAFNARDAVSIRKHYNIISRAGY